jgi:hypothetical protein
LKKHFGDAIVIQCQQGQGTSNIVYSSSICLSEAIVKANRLKAYMNSIRTHDLSDFGDLAIFYLKHLSMLFQSVETIVDVFDRYELKNSIKSAERTSLSSSWWAQDLSCK